eukprot:TRINITY_DN10801_c0_g1_i1.p1 TRINITY_DN10801_c0_g1~~TRINITY_DN10801_c0_g1_i1.p1  ORF type:complete len:641 (+),score=88.50 TRINITY_DN10801_c0_g1_i1:95-1924(+)
MQDVPVGERRSVKDVEHGSDGCWHSALCTFRPALDYSRSTLFARNSARITTREVGRSWRSARIEQGQFAEYAQKRTNGEHLLENTATDSFCFAQLPGCTSTLFQQTKGLSVVRAACIIQSRWRSFKILRCGPERLRADERRRQREAAQRWLLPREHLANMLGSVWRAYRARKLRLHDKALIIDRTCLHRSRQEVASAFIQRTWRAYKRAARSKLVSAVLGRFEFFPPAVVQEEAIVLHDVDVDASCDHTILTCFADSSVEHRSNYVQNRAVTRTRDADNTRRIGESDGATFRDAEKHPTANRFALCAEIVASSVEDVAELSSDRLANDCIAERTENSNISMSQSASTRGAVFVTEVDTTRCCNALSEHLWDNRSASISTPTSELNDLISEIGSDDDRVSFEDSTAVVAIATGVSHVIDARVDVQSQRCLSAPFLSSAETAALTQRLQGLQHAPEDAQSHSARPLKVTPPAIRAPLFRRREGQQRFLNFVPWRSRQAVTQAQSGLLGDVVDASNLPLCSPQLLQRPLAPPTAKQQPTPASQRRQFPLVGALVPLDLRRAATKATMVEPLSIFSGEGVGSRRRRRRHHQTEEKHDHLPRLVLPVRYTSSRR